MTLRTTAIRAALCAGTLLGMAACGADHGTPEELGRAVAEAANAEDADTIKVLTCAKDRAAFAEDFDFAKVRKDLGADDLGIKVTFVKAEKNDNAATLVFKTTFENLPKAMRDMDMPSTTENKQRAVKEDDRWVLCLVEAAGVTADERPGT